MASSFLVCYPDVPKSALVVSSTSVFDTDYPVHSLAYGERHAYGQLQSTNTTLTITWDLGTGNARTVDHFILGGAQVLKANGVTQATLQGSNNGSSWTNQLGSASGFQTRTFDGPDDDDLIFTAAYNDQYAATLASYRYFRVTLAGGSAHKFPVSKIYFGTALDLGYEPDFYDPEILTERDADTWQYDRGQPILSKAYYPKYRFTIEWDGLTDAKAQEVSEKLLHNPYRHHVFLYTATYLDPLYDLKLLHCRVVDDACTLEKSNEKIDWWKLSLVFEEL